MTNFTEKQIQGMIAELKDMFGSDIATRELALLELEDMKRKGCAFEYACKYDQCRGCSISDKCPVVDWETRHPEYANDELATKIKILEAGGEEAYKAKLKAQDEAKKKAEEEKLKALDIDILNAARQLLKLYFTAQVDGKTATDYLEALSDVLNADLKPEIEAAFINILGSKQL